MGAIYLIRHGQASFGARDYDALSATGLEQAGVLGAALRLRVPQVDAVISGGMRRHQQTAQGCLQAMGLPAQWTEHTGWNEYDHDEIVERYKPEYESGLKLRWDMARTLEPRKAFQAMFEKAVERWIGGEHDTEYREPWPQFSGRVNGALHALVRDLGKSRTALVFTSGGVISAICTDLLHVPTRDAYRLNRVVANASVTKLIYGGSGVHLSSFNEHAHFEGEGRERLITYR